MTKWIKIAFISIGVSFSCLLILEYILANILFTQSMVKTRINMTESITEEKVYSITNALENVRDYNSSLEGFRCTKKEMEFFCINTDGYKVLVTDEYVDIITPKTTSFLRAHDYVSLDHIRVLTVLTILFEENIDSISTYYTGMEFERPAG